MRTPGVSEGGSRGSQSHDSWQKLIPDTVLWQGDAAVSSRTLADKPALLQQFRIDTATRWTSEGPRGRLIVVLSGSMRVSQGPHLAQGDVLWVPAGTQIHADTNAPTLLYQLALADVVGPTSIQAVHSAQMPWQQFEDPAERPTQPVQMLLDVPDLCVLRTRFAPGFSAGEHWHDFDTWYFITDGDMRFGHEGVYAAGEVRQVQGGYSYGPETPGEHGVEFVLVSVGGPIALHWADLQAAPKGRLPA